MVLENEEVLETIGVGRYQYLQCFLLGGLYLTDGAEMLVSSSILGSLQETWHISNTMKGIMMSTTFVGVALGGLAGGRCADVMGRRFVTLWSFLGEMVIGALSATASGPGVMLLLRFCLGFCFGAGIPAAMALTLETAPEAGGKHLINLGFVWFGVGEVYAAAILSIFMPTLTDTTDSQWRTVVVLSILPAIMLFPGVMLTLQESPSWLLAYGKKSEALRVLKYIANFNHCEVLVSELQDVEPSQLHSMADASSGLLSHPELHGAMHGSADDGELPPRVAAAASGPVAPMAKLSALELLIFPEFRWTLISGTWLCFVANFLFYGTSYMLPQIFKSFGSHMSPATQLLIAAVATFPGVVLGDMLLLCRRLTDRDRLVILSGAIGIMEMALSQMRPDRPHHAQIMIVTIFSLKVCLTAFFNIAYVFIGRVFPAACRCTATSICITGGRLGSISAPMLCEVLQGPGPSGRAGSTFQFCASLSMLTILVIRCLLREYDDVEVEQPHGQEAAWPETLKKHVASPTASPQPMTISPSVTVPDFYSSTACSGRLRRASTAMTATASRRPRRRLSSMATDLPEDVLEFLARPAHPLAPGVP